ncbi:hypothetical protein KI659_18465 [Litoribacter alkaliphilus]|uniref:Uncharacterized protein n=1 Tax=Litoribacter ruber TaxID=702568 RepID=A0AAP2G5Y0_9BACT|nr:hypothetical protein [Litoribacter alkaliphilus]MBS9526010.1 hypothetical protein [Litoribacter alkaliphilus]
MSKILSKAGVNDFEEPGWLFGSLGHMLLGLSFVLTGMVITFAFGEWAFGPQTNFAWARSPLILLNCVFFFLFWPLHLAAKDSLRFYDFLKKHYPEKLEEQSLVFSEWISRLAKPRLEFIIPFLMMFFAAFFAFLNDAPHWWEYAKAPIIALLITFQVFSIWENWQFKKVIKEEKQRLE